MMTTVITQLIKISTEMRRVLPGIYDVFQITKEDPVIENLKTEYQEYIKMCKAQMRGATFHSPADRRAKKVLQRCSAQRV